MESGPPAKNSIISFFIFLLTNPHRAFGLARVGSITLSNTISRRRTVRTAFQITQVARSFLWECHNTTLFLTLLRPIPVPKLNAKNVQISITINIAFYATYVK
jgi:predicted choloylglycine hydrolase